MLRILKLGLLAVTLTTSVPVLAVRVIDQSNLVDPANGSLLASSIYRLDVPSESQVGQAQTVTAGRAGILGAIDLQLLSYSASTRNEPYTVSIYDGALVEGSGTLIGTVQVAAGDTPTEAQAQAGQLLTLELSSFNYAVVPGQVFTIYTSIPASGPDFGRGPRLIYGSAAGYDDEGLPFGVVGLDYARGYNAITFGNGSDLETLYDRGFRTYVDTAAATVPEPASWALFVAGFGISGAILRGRRQAAA